MKLWSRGARRNWLFAGTVLGLACGTGGCATVDLDDILPSIRTSETVLEQGIQLLRSRLSPQDREVLDDELLSRRDLLIHISLGRIPRELSRGGMSTLAQNARDNGWCRRHPNVGNVPWNRDWDVIYDPEIAKYWERRLNIPHPIEVSLYHEIFGHILPVLRNPELLAVLKEHPESKNDFEFNGRAAENDFRKYLGLPGIPDELPEQSTP